MRAKRPMWALSAGLMFLALAGAARADERKLWEYERGKIEQVGDRKWVHEMGGKKTELVEERRTADYVELWDAAGMLRYKLYAGYATVQKRMAVTRINGRWDAATAGKPDDKPKPGDDPKPGDRPKPGTHVATGKPADRDYWKHDKGHFEKTGDKTWTEKAPDGKTYEYKEMMRTDRVVRLYDAGRKVSLSLLDDRCETMEGRGPASRSKKLYDGHWGKEPAVAGKPKPPEGPAPEWTDDLAKMMKIPDAPVVGSIGGKEFRPAAVFYDTFTGELIFRTPADRFKAPEAEIQIKFKRAVGNSTPRGRTFKKGFNDPATAKDLTIAYRWQEQPGGDAPIKGEIRYAIYAEFGEQRGDKLPGKIYFCLPDKNKTFVAGTFEATVRK